MKKHLLSMYGNFCKNKEIIDLGKTTYETSTIETTIQKTKSNNCIKLNG